MPIITDKNQSLELIEKLREKRVSMAIFCTASHWNTEAILIAASRFAEKNNISDLPLAVAMTFNYRHMPQAQRVTFKGDALSGFVSVMEHLKVLTGSKNSVYPNVTVLPHLDHADPVNDRWALTRGLDYLSSVMFDAQKYPADQNIALTNEYVSEYGNRVMIEGVMDELSVEGGSGGSADEGYVDKAVNYIKSTGVDFLVADLGTEQQSSKTGKGRYFRERAVEITKKVGKSILVLHGTSCLSDEQMRTLPDDGIIRVNMWTRIAREAGQYAYVKLQERQKEIMRGSFEATESRQYLYDSTEKAAEIMEHTLGILGYANLSDRS